MANLVGDILFDTGGFQATDPRIQNGVLWMFYENTSTQTRYFKSMSVMLGMLKGATGDLSANINRSSDWSWVLGHGWDHYADPTAPASYTYYFTPDYVELGPGDKFCLAVVFHPSVGNPYAQASVLGRYTLEP